MAEFGTHAAVPAVAKHPRKNLSPWPPGIDRSNSSANATLNIAANIGANIPADLTAAPAPNRASLPVRLAPADSVG